MWFLIRGGSDEGSAGLLRSFYISPLSVCSWLILIQRAVNALSPWVEVILLPSNAMLLMISLYKKRPEINNKVHMKAEEGAADSRIECAFLDGSATHVQYERYQGK